MNTTTVLDNLQKIIEYAETLASAVPEEAMDDMWLHETIDNALGELERTEAYLKDKYDLDVYFPDDDEFSDNDLDDSFLDDDDNTDFCGFGFEEFADDEDEN